MQTERISFLVCCDDVNSADEKHKWHKGKQNLY